jgi:hypothetical protein
MGLIEERTKTIEESIARAPGFASERGHKTGSFTRQSRRRYVAAEAICTKCGGLILIDTEGVIKVPLICN